MLTSVAYSTQLFWSAPEEPAEEEVAPEPAPGLHPFASLFPPNALLSPLLQGAQFVNVNGHPVRYVFAPQAPQTYLQPSPVAAPTAYSAPPPQQFPIPGPTYQQHTAPAAANDVVHSEFTDGVLRITSPNQSYEYKYPKINTLPLAVSNEDNYKSGFTSYGVPFDNSQPAFDVAQFAPQTDEVSSPAEHLELPVPDHPAPLIFPHPAIYAPQPPLFHSEGPIVAAESSNDDFASGLEHQNVSVDENQYINEFTLTDGTKVVEHGQLVRSADGYENIIAKSGSYEYVSPEGVPVKVSWVADENGFRVLE